MKDADDDSLEIVAPTTGAAAQERGPAAPRLTKTRQKEIIKTLAKAVQDGDQKEVKAILDQVGIECDQVIDDSLHVACAKGHKGIVEAILNAFSLPGLSLAVDLPNPKSTGQSPLSVACEHGHVEIAELLLKKGADPCFLDKNHWTPLHFAASNGQHKIVELLLSSKDPELVKKRDIDGLTPLTLACMNGRGQVVEQLIKAGADINKCDKQQWTPLMAAAEKDHATVIETLLNSDANPLRTAGPQKQTAFLIACENGSIAAVKAFLAHPKVTNECLQMTDKKGKGPLHIATLNEKGHVMKVLLDDSRFDVNSVDERGWTPLHIACHCGFAVLARILLNYGADKERLTTTGETPDQANTFTPMMLAADSGASDVIQVLIEHNCSALAPGSDGWTPLHCASKNGYCDAIRVLLKAGAKINEPQADGQTPLFLSSWYGKLDSTRLLLDSGASINTTEANGRTPLYAACQEQQVKIVQLLLERGADATIHPPGLRSITELVKWLANPELIVQFKIDAKEVSNRKTPRTPTKSPQKQRQPSLEKKRVARGSPRGPVAKKIKREKSPSPDPVMNLAPPPTFQEEDVKPPKEPLLVAKEEVVSRPLTEEKKPSVDEKLKQRVKDLETELETTKDQLEKYRNTLDFVERDNKKLVEEKKTLCSSSNSSECKKRKQRSKNEKKEQPRHSQCFCPHLLSLSTGMISGHASKLRQVN